MLSKDSQHKLNLFLSEDISSVRAREAQMFDDLARPYQKSIVLYGAGTLGKKIASGLRSKGIEPLAFTDRNDELWGKCISSIKILSPHEAVRKYGDSAVFVVSIWSPASGNALLDASEILSQFGRVRIIPFVPLFYKYEDVFLPYYCIDLPSKITEQSSEVKLAFNLLKDEKSRNEFISHISFRFNGDPGAFGTTSEVDQYFLDEIIPLSSYETFIDCGAFNGDTLSEFLRKQNDFMHYIAFEPDPDNYRKLFQSVNLLEPSIKAKIRCYELATSNESKEVYFEAQGNGGSFVNQNGSSAFNVECVALDNFLEGVDPTYIKMDIEGSELETLVGARNIIQASQPILAVCAYHKPEDIWSIPSLIHSFNDNYEFYYRRHEAEGWDLVCYAIPKIIHR